MDSFIELFIENDVQTNHDLHDHEDCLPPEPQQGNIEYKLKLINPSHERFEHLVTQMKWRLQEGHGEAIYQIGVEDNGKLAGISKDEMATSLKTLKDMANKLGATITVLRERSAKSIAVNNRKTKLKNHSNDVKSIAEVLIKKIRKDDVDNENVIDLRLAVMGGLDAGKSTLLGVLTQGELDNGRGRSRLNMLRHLHEIKSGRTSSISHEIIGFNSKGQVLNYANMKTAEEICENASKVVSFIDLAGHTKYLRTTLLGLTGYSPHYVMLVVAPPVNDAVHEHMALCLTLRLPFFVVVNKVDLGYRNPMETISKLETIAKRYGCIKKFLFINNNSHSRNVNKDLMVIPVFPVSCVSGEGVEELTNFIKYLLPSELVPSDSCSESCLFQIDETFRIIGSPEPVLGGLLVRGTVSLGAKLLLGPSPNGEFSPVKVISLRRNKAPCCLVRASQSASLILAPATHRDSLPHFRPGMVLISIKDHPNATIFFQATIIVIYHSTAIYPGFQATVHVGNVRQTCIIEGIMNIKQTGLQTNDSASVLFRFLSHPEYLQVGMKLLLREGRTKANGKITQIFPIVGIPNNKK